MILRSPINADKILQLFVQVNHYLSFFYFGARDAAIKPVPALIKLLMA
jgi:hypothetical protein